MLPLQPYQLLDELLKKLKDSTEQQPVSLLLLRHQENVFKDVSNRDWEAMRRKLKDDKMIDSLILPEDETFANSVELYFITFDGIILLENEGGYQGRYNKMLANEKRIEIIEEKQLYYTKVVANLTGAIVVFTFISVLIALFSYLSSRSQKPLYPSHIDVLYKGKIQHDTLLLKIQ